VWSRARWGCCLGEVTDNGKGRLIPRKCLTAGPPLLRLELEVFHAQAQRFAANFRRKHSNSEPLPRTRSQRPPFPLPAFVSTVTCHLLQHHRTIHTATRAGTQIPESDGSYCGRSDTNLSRSGRDSAVGIATGYGLHGRGVGVRDRRVKNIFHIVQCRFWGRPSLLSSRYRELFLRWYSRRDVKLTTHLELMPRSRIHGSVHALPCMPSWRRA
jgi:hypothetical protein